MSFNLRVVEFMRHDRIAEVGWNQLSGVLFAVRILWTIVTAVTAASSDRMYATNLKPVGISSDQPNNKLQIPYATPNPNATANSAPIQAPIPNRLHFRDTATPLTREARHHFWDAVEKEIEFDHGFQSFAIRYPLKRWARVTPALMTSRQTSCTGL
jgi:hypothetical protein